jgi:hypothetical protein
LQLQQLMPATVAKVRPIRAFLLLRGIPKTMCSGVL